MMNILDNNGAHIDDIYYCPHNADDECSCRKPKPGMIKEAAKKHDIDLKKSWMIGDNNRDIEAGHRANCNSILVEKNKNIENTINMIIAQS